jgi:predicted HTH domain antitoxin
MKQLTLNVPEEVSEYEVKMTVASLLFDRGLFSSGQAADFVGISKREFLEKIGYYGVSIFGETSEDLKSVHE